MFWRWTKVLQVWKTWGWVINDRIFILGWTNPLKSVKTAFIVCFLIKLIWKLIKRHSFVHFQCITKPCVAFCLIRTRPAVGTASSSAVWTAGRPAWILWPSRTAPSPLPSRTSAAPRSHDPASVRWARFPRTPSANPSELQRRWGERHTSQRPANGCILSAQPALTWERADSPAWLCWVLILLNI